MAIDSQAPSPIIILDQPQMGENIGAAARAMGNFGIKQLRLVSPRDGWPNEKAKIMASHAGDIIENATVHTRFHDAIADCHRVYATTSRSRNVAIPVLTPREAAMEIVQHHLQGQQSAIMFGAERTGLENDPITFANALVVIPVDTAYASMNLAQAVVICAYEWFVAAKGTIPVSPHKKELASKHEIEGMFDHLATSLDTKGFFSTPALKPSMVRNIRTMLTRADFSSQEVRTLRGIIRALVGRE